MALLQSWYATNVRENFDSLTFSCCVVSLGRTFKAMNKHTDAIEWFIKAIEIDSTLKVACNEIGKRFFC